LARGNLKLNGQTEFEKPLRKGRLKLYSDKIFLKYIKFMLYFDTLSF
jgi:hypothetical protein